MSWVIFVVGLVIGANVGLVIAGLLAQLRRNEDDLEARHGRVTTLPTEPAESLDITEYVGGLPGAER